MRIPTVQHCRYCLLIASVYLSLVWPLVAASIGQDVAIPASQRSLDFVRLADGQSLYGFVLKQRQDGGLTLAVQSRWLQKVAPAFYQRQVQLMQDRQNSSREQLLVRLKEWLEDCRQRNAGDGALIRFLESERERLSDSGDPKELATFLVLDLPANDVQSVRLAAPERKRIGGLAFQHRLAEVTSSRTSDLRRKLREIGVDLQSAQFDLRDQLPRPLAADTQRQWDARRALVDFHYREALEFHGTETNLIRKTDESNAIAMTRLLSQWGSQQTIAEMGAELGLPEFAGLTAVESEPFWRTPTRIAEKEGVNGVLMTIMNQSRLGREVHVATHFFARAESGEWFRIYHFKTHVQVDDVPDLKVQRLRQDPQIKSILAIASSLAVGPSVELALRYGAAAEIALETNRSEFSLFLARHIRALDSPPLAIETHRKSLDVSGPK